MNTKESINFVLKEAIESEAFVMTMISCVLCECDLMASDLDIEEANDPMEVWAEKFSKAAQRKGWSVSSLGSILCPECCENNDT